jgi:hypothetical protein
MGAKCEVFYEAKQIRTNTPATCIVCCKDRILNWSEDYQQWICDKCSGEIPSNIKTLKFKWHKKMLLQRKYRLRDVKKWKEKNGY